MSVTYLGAVALGFVLGTVFSAVGLLADGPAQIVLFCVAIAMLVVAWFVRLRCLTCQGCGKSCAPLMVKKGTTVACPYCGTPYLFEEEKGRQPGSQKRRKK